MSFVKWHRRHAGFVLCSLWREVFFLPWFKISHLATSPMLWVFIRMIGEWEISLLIAEVSTIVQAMARRLARHLLGVLPVPHGTISPQDRVQRGPKRQHASKAVVKVQGRSDGVAMNRVRRCPKPSSTCARRLYEMLLWRRPRMEGPITGKIGAITFPHCPI